VQVPHRISGSSRSFSVLCGIRFHLALFSWLANLIRALSLVSSKPPLGSLDGIAVPRYRFETNLPRNLSSGNGAFLSIDALLDAFEDLNTCFLLPVIRINSGMNSAIFFAFLMI
jgi:hypothetical protein